MSYQKEKRVVSPVVAAIREERRRQKIGLQRFGKMTGYAHQHLWQIEVGKQGVRIDILETLAAALGVEIVLSSDMSGLRAELAAETKRVEEAESDRDDYKRTANDYYRDNIGLRKERDTLRAELAAAKEKLDAYDMDGAAAAMAVRKAEAERDALRELLEVLRTGIAVLGDTTKHLGLQLGQDRAAELIARIDAVLNGGGE